MHLTSPVARMKSGDLGDPHDFYRTLKNFISASNIMACKRTYYENNIFIK
ncbi:hypothetical protein Q7O_003130 [Pectobacterium carotovorum subsp. carotovorum PCCS1]|nr:hypothetical protein [Pectobacterium carotovorum subsp. carotovorum PCCS1]